MKRIAGCGVLVCGCCVAFASDIAPPRPIDVAALVRQLESEDAGERKRALERLMALPVDEPPAELLAGLKDENPVIRFGVAKAAQAIRSRAALPTLPRGEKFARQGEIDLFVAATATWNLAPDDERLWAPPYEVWGRLVAKSGLTGDGRPRAPVKGIDFAKFRTEKRLIRTRDVYSRPAKDEKGQPITSHPEAIQAAGVADPRSIGSSLVVSRGPVSAKVIINGSLILATGDVTAGHDMTDSVVVCDGDVHVANDATICLIIARGKITIGGNAHTCYLIAGGTVEVGKPLSRVEGLKTAIVEKESYPFGYVSFFELRQAGLDVRAKDGVLWIAGVGTAMPADKAGIKAKDVVLEVNGKKPSDVESLRRLLRDALAVGDAAVKLQRGSDTLTVKLSLPE